jgi:hypothetical protein
MHLNPETDIWFNQAIDKKESRGEHPLDSFLSR